MRAAQAAGLTAHARDPLLAAAPRARRLHPHGSGDALPRRWVGHAQLHAQKSTVALLGSCVLRPTADTFGLPHPPRCSFDALVQKLPTLRPRPSFDKAEVDTVLRHLEADNSIMRALMPAEVCAFAVLGWHSGRWPRRHQLRAETLLPTHTQVPQASRSDPFDLRVASLSSSF